MNDLEEARRHVQLLAEALTKVLISVGAIRDDVQCADGATLLMVAEDFVEMRKVADPIKGTSIG